MKTIYLHVGNYKTGSSAIQAYLSRHAQALRASGYFYPDVCRPRYNPTNHGRLSLSLGQDHGFFPPPWYDDNISTDSAFAELDAALRTAPEPNIILSSEEFVQLTLRADPKAAMADLAERLSGHDVRIIFYLREPMSLLKSWFNEVNKGPNRTRTFPTFFGGLNGGFISQRPIVEAFDAAFGADKVTVLAYRHKGAAHVAHFLRAIGCDHVVRDDANPLVNKAQSLRELEAGRIRRAKEDDFDWVTVTDIADIAHYRKRADIICANYNRIAQRADAVIPGKLSALAVFDHYLSLLQAGKDVVRFNLAEADQLRNMALAIEKTDLPLARTMMTAAALIRPDGAFTRGKLAEYDLSLIGDRS